MRFWGTKHCIPKRWPMGPLQLRLPSLAQTSGYAYWYYQCNYWGTATLALQYCLWRNKHNSFHNVITMDDL